LSLLLYFYEFIKEHNSYRLFISFKQENNLGQTPKSFCLNHKSLVRNFVEFKT